MTVHVDVWIRGTSEAVTRTFEGIPREPAEWIDEDVQAVLEGMLHAMDELKNPGQAKRVAALRGFSWIVNPYDQGGVLIAIELTLGAAVAGPFSVDKAKLDAMIERVMGAQSSSPGRVH